MQKANVKQTTGYILERKVQAGELEAMLAVVEAGLPNITDEKQKADILGLMETMKEKLVPGRWDWVTSKVYRVHLQGFINGLKEGTEYRISKGTITYDANTGYGMVSTPADAVVIAEGKIVADSIMEWEVKN